MKIEIAEPGRMTQSGSSLLKLIQNNNMPILDLLVRESIQNSLDAKNENDPYVTVEFKTGTFPSKDLNHELEGISEALNNKYSGIDCDFVAIKDSNTVGLTGKLHYDDVQDNNYGNLLKLIYEISKPQEAEGAGGSWGLGKTVYFRIGIGLVIYYSRIKNEEGNFESRLAASLVENEMKEDSLIPVWNGKSKRGIAWWGEKFDLNKTQPITNIDYIEKVLKIFAIEPFQGSETGTTIIIPYIDKDKLLESNQVEYHDGEEKIIHPFWLNSVEEYLRIAVQRWYASRLNNVHYPYGKYLRAKVNDIGISKDIMEPVYQIVQALYNRAVTKNNTLDDLLNNGSIVTKFDEIAIRKVLYNTDAGVIAYTKVKRSLLKMNYPDNKPSPYMFFNCEILDSEKNKPIIAFTRKPGMIVSYECVGNWADGIGTTDKDEFIIAIFVLNSDNKLVGVSENSSLEEYIRKSEMADHTSWSDFTIESQNPRIVSRIQTQVKSKIAKEFSVEDEDNVSKLNSGLGKMFGDLILPPENFGKKPSVGTGENKNPVKHIEKHKNVVFTMDKNSIKYLGQTMEISMQIKTKGKINKSGVKMAIDSETGMISINEWENKMGMNTPFYIESIAVEFEKYDDEKIDNHQIVILNDGNNSNDFHDIKCNLLKSSSKKNYAIELISQTEHSYTVNFKINLYLIKRDIKPVFVVEKNEGDK